MKTITKLLAAILLLGSIIPVCAQAYKTREVANAPAFTAVEVNGGDVNVYFSQGEGYSFSVNGPAKLVKAIKIKVKENTLFIDYAEPFFTGDDDVAVYVTAPKLDRIAASGETDFEIKTPFQTEELTIKTRQNGEVSIKNATIGQLKIDAKGSSSVDIDYLEAQIIRVSSLDRAEVELAGRTGQMEILAKGVFAEVDAKKLTITQPAAANGEVAGQVAKDGSVEFTFND